MDKRQQRTQNKIDSIKHAALALFTSHGLDKVSMDEIAAKAKVSKVTIYKYFSTKEELYSEAINLLIDEILASTEAILNSDRKFLDKLKSILELQADSLQKVSSNYLFQLWEQDEQAAIGITESLQAKVQALMYRFYEEGKSKGYIRESISFESLFLYAEIFRAGLRALSVSSEATPLDKNTLEDVYQLYFFGFINPD